MYFKSNQLLTVNSAIAKSVASLNAAGLLMVAQGLTMVPAASAETLARANGRCKLTSDEYKAFDGHCTVKQKCYKLLVRT